MNREDILFFVYENQLDGKLVSWSDLENEFVRKKGEGQDSKKCAKQTFVNKLKQLLVSGKLQKTLNEKGRPVYFAPKKHHKFIEKLIAKRDIYDLTDYFDVKWLKMLRNLLVNMRKEGTDPYVYFQSYCLGFIGGIPYTFYKTKEDMQAKIEWEKVLETRARKEGLTKEEYWRKMLKKAARMPKGVPRILTSLGFTKEEIDELRRKQGGTFKVTRRTRKKS